MLALIRETVALQGYEEARHAAVIQGLTTHYGLPVSPPPPAPAPADPEWAFMRLGYSECFDAFFTFALFAIARDSGFFPSVLVEKFEPVMQEEARHILFFVNWEAYRQAQSPLWQRPRHLWRGALGRVLQVWRRVQGAMGARADKALPSSKPLEAAKSADDALAATLDVGEELPEDREQLRRRALLGVFWQSAKVLP